MKKLKFKSEYIFDIINSLIMIAICICTIYPFLYLAVSSVSATDMGANGLSLIPQKVTAVAYKRVFTNSLIGTGFMNTIARTALGTFLSLCFTICAAYPLSKKYFPNRTLWTALIVFTMYFQGGTIPTFLVVKGLGLTDKIWALVLPGLINTFNMIIMRNFFMELPSSLEESARLDGANDFVILLRIALPVSKPIIATIVLWTAVAHWNAYFDSMIYMSSLKKQVLQVVMRRIVIEGSSLAMDFGSGAGDFDAGTNTISTEGIKAATIMVATLPIILFYPFLQKYFVKGVMVGSLKG